MIKFDSCNIFKPILKRLQVKAQQAYRDANSGVPPKIPNDIFKPSNPEEETKDELSIFSGKTHTLLTAKSTPPAVPNTVGTPSSTKSRSSSDSPQLVMPDNPSFKGVHPSLVSELNVFNGFIKRQLENAYKAGGEVFGGEPMVVDGQEGSGGGVRHHQQSAQMHVVRQQHQQHQQSQQYQNQQPQQVMYQPDYQRQHFDKQEAAKRSERDREEAANREMERQEMEKHEIERQELARQQQLHQQREIQRQQQQLELLRQQQQAQQQEIIQQQQQQLDIRRQQEKQQQMQDQYRQQLEVPQHQLQQRQTPSQYHLQRHPYDHDQPPMITEPDHGILTSSAQPATAPPIRTLSHSQSQRNIHHPYQQQRPHHYQSIHHPDTAGGVSSFAPSPPTQRVTQRGAQQPIRYSTVAPQPQQHSMYTVPPEYPSSPDSIQTGGVSYVPPPSTSSTYLPPTPISASSSPSSYVPQWSAGSYTFAMPDQQATPAASSSASGSGSGYAWANTPRIHTPEYQHQQYTPEGALRGIAADDRSLQETWQSYMNKVRTPPCVG